MKHVWWMTGCRRRRATDREPKSTILVLLIKLGIKCFIPDRPVGKLLKIASSEAFELGLLWGHVIGLQMGNHFGDLDVRQTVSIGTETSFIVSLGEIGTIDGLKSTDSTKVMQSEIQWRRVVIMEFSRTFASEAQII
jgi:hypothetical protein